MDFDNVIIIVIIGFFFSHCSSHNKHTLGTNAVPNIQLHPRHTKHAHTHTQSHCLAWVSLVGWLSPHTADGTGKTIRK